MYNLKLVTSNMDQISQVSLRKQQNKLFCTAGDTNIAGNTHVYSVQRYHTVTCAINMH